MHISLGRSFACCGPNFCTARASFKPWKSFRSMVKPIQQALDLQRSSMLRPVGHAWQTHRGTCSQHLSLFRTIGASGQLAAGKACYTSILDSKVYQGRSYGHYWFFAAMDNVQSCCYVGDLNCRFSTCASFLALSLRASCISIPGISNRLSSTRRAEYSSADMCHHVNHVPMFFAAPAQPQRIVWSFQATVPPRLYGQRPPISMKVLSM